MLTYRRDHIWQCGICQWVPRWCIGQGGKGTPVWNDCLAWVSSPSPPLDPPPTPSTLTSTRVNRSRREERKLLKDKFLFLWLQVHKRPV